MWYRNWLHLRKTYVGAWTREEHETNVQRWAEATASVAAPSLLLAAMLQLNYQYRASELLPYVQIASVLVVVLALAALLFACSSLEAHLEGRASKEEDAGLPLRGSPMLVFAAFLFTAGAAFTGVEAVDHFGFRMGVGFNENQERNEFDSPWGDILLACSAICMLIEEFILLTMYDSVKREAGRVRMLLDRARAAVSKELEELRGKVTEEMKSASEKTQDIARLRTEAEDRSRKIGETLGTVRRQHREVMRYRKETEDAAQEITRWQGTARRALRSWRAAVFVLVLVGLFAGTAGAVAFGMWVGQYDRRLQSRWNDVDLRIEERLAAMDETVERDEAGAEAGAEPANVVEGSGEIGEEADEGEREDGQDGDGEAREDEPGQPPDGTLGSVGGGGSAVEEQGNGARSGEPGAPREDEEE